MRSTSGARPSSGGGGGDDDYAFYYSFFQDAAAAAASPLGLDDAAAMTNGGRKRKRGGGGDGADGGAPAASRKDGPGGDGEGGNGRKRSIAKILTSLAALEAEEHSDRAGAADASRRELALLESNADHKSQAMMDYYAKMEGSFDAAAESDAAARSKRSRLAASAATAAVVATEEGAAETASASASPSRASGGGGAGHHQRRLWVKDRSRAWWDKCNSPDYPEEEFRRAFRMGRETFDMICEALGSAVAKEDTMLRAAIPVRQRVAVCIWRLATGEPLRLVSKRFGLGISTCHKLVLEVCAAIKSVLMPRFLQWPDEAAAAAFKERFQAAYGVPGVIGAMYTTHIPIIAPKISVAAYFNRRHTERNQKTSYSITLQGVVGPDGAFTDVCIGWPGSMPDDQVLEKSMLHQRAAAGMMHSACLVGGASYPLMDWVLVPYTHQNLTWTQHAFNEKVGDLRRVAVDAFARLKARWACLQKRTEVKLQDLPVVLGACCVLHNICETRGEELEPELRFELVDDETSPETPVRSEAAKRARDNIAHNLLHRGFAGTTFF
ncbi:protein ANTAGONIST OF LIKE HETEROCHROMATIN PROTEIN 1-like [Oryza glaberrima]|uniref:protein ANTAGONIST OF LIKE HETEROCHROMATIN PROTEIN 1-like n=1 Tax=Oryza glaberrima TaxID=4538 RepID=UPI00224C37E7|nr:protein ANTAGONIST OF LIKE HETEROCHROMATIN PROTEIN 1-like [Oryza glaberrima]